MIDLRRRRFTQQRLVWGLSFEEWWSIWQRSGKWKKRGRCRGQFCMARFNDRGSYEVGNVSIVSALVNIKEVKPYYRNSIWRHDQANRMKGNTFSRGRKHSDQARKRMSKSLKGRVPGFAGKRHSEATKRKMRSNWRNQFTVGEHQ